MVVPRGDSAHRAQYGTYRDGTSLDPINPTDVWVNFVGVTFVIALPCVDVKDRACVDECPVDCIYEGDRMLYIQPDECIDCGACEPVCPVEAIYFDADLPAEWEPYAEANAEFFRMPLPGRDAPLGRPNGAARIGALHGDAPLVAAIPTQAP